MNTEMSNAEKWAALVKWVEDTDGDEDADIWNYLGDELGVEPDGSKNDEDDEDDEEDEEEYDTLDMKVLGFKTTERLDGNWHSLLFEIRNYGDDDEEELICGSTNGGGCGVKGWRMGGAIQFGCECGEEEKDECEGCEKEVVVDYEDYKGYTIANCNNCSLMLCRDCLESGTADMCKYCVVSVVENFAENLNSYPKEKVDRIIAMMKEDMLE